MNRANQDIREAAKAAGIRLWRIADALQTQDNSFSRRLRRELPQHEKGKILAIIKQLKIEQDQEGAS